MSDLHKKIGIVIINYNKHDATLKCLESIAASKGFDTDEVSYDIYIVDSSSNSNSSKLTTSSFNDKFHLTTLSSDFGVSGAIYIGARRALDNNCDYIFVVNETITLDEYALITLYNYMENNPNVGMASGKVYYTHMPDYIQQYGISIDFKHYRAVSLYSDALDDNSLPSEVYCDATGWYGVLIPANVIKKVGAISQDGYIYWDDIDYCYQVKQAGYDIIAYGDAKIYNSASPFRRTYDTKLNYYSTRNALHFFMKYTPAEECVKMCNVLLKSIFDSIYLRQMGQAHNMAQSDISALLDAINGIKEKAHDNRILDNDETGMGFVSFFEEQEAIYMEDDDPFLEQVIRQINPDIIFKQFYDKDTVSIIRCHSILDLQDFNYNLEYTQKVVYIDAQYRMVSNEDEITQIKNYKSNLQQFLYIFQPAMLRRISEIRNLEF